MFKTPCRISYVNGCYTPHYQASTHIEDRGYQFSDGVYEVIALIDGRLLDAEPHFTRLERSLFELSIAFSRMRQLPIIIQELQRRNTIPEGFVYIQITRGIAPRNHPFPEKPISPSLVITLHKKVISAKSVEAKSMRVVTHPDIRWQRRDIKSISLLPNILAKQYAAEHGAGEAWLYGANDVITEGSASNSYIVKDNSLYTHPQGDAILSGITRQVVLKLARELGINVIEKAFTKDEAYQADEAFVTSTTMGVMPVIEIDGTPVSEGRAGEITQKLLHAYAKHISIL